MTTPVTRTAPVAPWHRPDLAHKLRFAPYEALYQHIAVRYQLPTFDLEETAGLSLKRAVTTGRTTASR